MRARTGVVMVSLFVTLLEYGCRTAVLAGDVIKLEIKVRKVHEDDNNDAAPKQIVIVVSEAKSETKPKTLDSRENVELSLSKDDAVTATNKYNAADEFFARNNLGGKDIVESVYDNDGKTDFYNDDNNGWWEKPAFSDVSDELPESTWLRDIADIDTNYNNGVFNNEKNDVTITTRHRKTFVREKATHKHVSPAVLSKKHQEPPKQSLSNDEYGGKLPFSGLAKVVLANEMGKTLEESYLPLQSSMPYGSGPKGSGYDYANYGQNLLLYLKFGKRSMESWDPRSSNNMQWQFYGTAAGQPADNAAFAAHGDTGEPGRIENSYKQEYHPQRTSVTYGVETDPNSYVVLYSTPFKKYYNNSDANSSYDYYEGVLESKSNYTIGPTQKLLYRFKFACEILNADRNPFPASQVSYPWDDSRLATCGFEIDNADETGLFLAITSTNTGVWAYYSRAGNSTAPNDNGTANGTIAQTFVSKRRIGRRARYDTLVDGAIEIDRRQSVINYYLNGYKIWSIGRVGVPPAEDGVTKIDYGQGAPQEAFPSQVKVNFGTYKCLDESDPNNPYNKQRLVRVQNSTTFYRANDTFYDNYAMKSNELWGQAAIMTLFKLVLLRAESTTGQPFASPAVYGGVGEMLHQYENAPTF